MKEKLKELFNKIYTPISELEGVGYFSNEPLPFAKKEQGEKFPLVKGEKWGELFDCAWFELHGVIPDEADGQKMVLMLDAGGEACVYTDDGCPYKGLTNVKSEFSFHLGMPAKQIVFDITPFRNRNSVHLWLDAGTNDLFGNFMDGGRFITKCVAVCDSEMRDFYYDMEVLCSLWESVLNDKELEDALNSAFELYKTDLPAARSFIRPFLERESKSDFKVTAIGHAHIDLAWLWPMRESKRKAARTLSTVVFNSRLYPDYVFGVSQPQMLDWVKSDHPLLYSQIKELHRQHRLETQGIFWVECDCNITGGESLVRQAVYGRRFWQEEFGDNQEMCWIPDVFGYNGQLPQIIKKSGGKYFLTTKMSWNAINRFPYSSFIWQGIDGSEVLSHLPPEGNYNSPASPWALNNIKNNFNEKNVSDKAVMLFGIGDGGGGPGMEHLERLKREKNLFGLPKTKQGYMADFFKSLENDRDKLPKWRGELYLEKHQGTYTTHAKNKQNNFFAERSLRLAELNALLAELFEKKPYPMDELDKAWKEVLLYQFHDILPGSSIKRVYNETDVAYAAISDTLESISGCKCQSNTFFNPTSFDRDEYVRSSHNGSVHIKSAPFAKCTVVSAAPETLYADESRFENDLIRVEFNKSGAITDIFDKQSGIHLIRSNANIYKVYSDTADAWEVPADYASSVYECFRLENQSLSVSEGFATLHQSYILGNSRLQADITLYANSKRLDFNISCDWQEEKSMLRADFPLNINADHANCEIQFGHVARPTHPNNSWETAKREVCAHKWIDISERAYGMAILSPEKYGYRVFDNILDINLLRQTTCPRETTDTDKGMQTFSYAVYPHTGDHVSGNVIREAYRFANPVCTHTPDYPYEGSLFSLSDTSAVIESVKKPCSGDGIVLRIYESTGATVNAKLWVNQVFGIKRAFETNLCEDCAVEIPFDGTALLSFTPFEIKTILLR